MVPIGLYLVHRAYDAKGSANIRAMVDAERVLLGGKAPLLKTEALLLAPTRSRARTSTGSSPRRARARSRSPSRTTSSSTSSAPRARVQDGGLFGYKKGQYNPQISVDTEDAIKAAERRDAPAVPPKIVEGGKKKSG